MCSAQHDSYIQPYKIYTINIRHYKNIGMISRVGASNKKIEQKNLELPSPRQPREKPGSIVLLFCFQGKTQRWAPLCCIYNCEVPAAAHSQHLIYLRKIHFNLEWVGGSSQSVLTHGLEWINTHHTCTYIPCVTWGHVTPHYVFF